MIDSGADVIFGAGGLTGNGALEAACQADGVLAIGVDTDQYETLPSVQSCILSSATKNIVEAVKNSLLRIAQDAFTPGFHTDNAATNGIGLAPFHDMDADVSAETKALLDETFAGLADGSIKTERRRRRQVDRGTLRHHGVRRAARPFGASPLSFILRWTVIVWRRPWPRSRRTRPPNPRLNTNRIGGVAPPRGIDHRGHTRSGDRRRGSRRRRDHHRPGGRGAARGPRARDARHQQALPGRRRQRRHRPVHPPGRDPRPARRERRRQEHADEHPVRAAHARRGRDPARREADPDQRAVRRDRPRDRHGPPALHARAGVHGGREHRARQRDDGQRGLPRRPQVGGPDPRPGHASSGSRSTRTPRPAICRSGSSSGSRSSRRSIAAPRSSSSTNRRRS